MKVCVGMCVGRFRTDGSGKQQWTLGEPCAGMVDGAQYQEDASCYPGRQLQQKDRLEQRFSACSARTLWGQTTHSQDSPKTIGK